MIERTYISFFIILFLLIFDSCHFANSQVYLAKDFQNSSNFVESIPLPYNESERVREDLYALFASYRMSCTGIEITEKNELYVIMRNGARILYDDRKHKSFEEKLANPDLKDMLEQKYVPGPVKENPAENFDPGRIRVIPFFQAIYGETQKDVIRNTLNIEFVKHHVAFNSIEGASAALQKVHKNLSILIKEKPELTKYVVSIAGTLKWRVIAGTQRLSPHSFAMAIDINPNQGAYWRWWAKGDIANIRREYPQSIISIFEEQGFIWGGKWYHYDLMHFEYRPELLLKHWNGERGKNDL